MNIESKEFMSKTFTRTMFRIDLSADTKLTMPKTLSVLL